MRITPLGAAGGEVTGSAYLIQTSQAKILVDAGLFQGGRTTEEKNRAPQTALPADVDAILLTHAHLDHIGRIPLLIREGYRGPIYATPATIGLADIILKDSARIQVSDADRDNRKRQRAGRELVEPLYTPQDAEPFKSLAKPIPYHEPVAVAPGIRARWVEAGHLLGSASIEVTVTEDGRDKIVAFSGDLGPLDRPILRDFETFSRADLVFLESTYGDRDHLPYDETLSEFERIIAETSAARGKILVPTFAIGRAQLVIFHLAVMFHQRHVEAFPIYLDSPMAIEANKVYQAHRELADEQTAEWLKLGVFPLSPEILHVTPTVEESRKLNALHGPCAILAGSGMCTAGRILHHFKQNLWRPGTHVIIVGYQGNGSLGRLLIDGADTVKIFGEEIAVRAKIHTLGGFSGHAGQADLLKWFQPLAASKPRLLLTHGEDGPRRALAAKLGETYGATAELPEIGAAITL